MPQSQTCPSCRGTGLITVYPGKTKRERLVAKRRAEDRCARCGKRKAHLDTHANCPECREYLNYYGKTRRQEAKIQAAEDEMVVKLRGVEHEQEQSIEAVEAPAPGVARDPGAGPAPGRVPLPDLRWPG